MNVDEHWMRVAIEMAQRGLDAGQTPFGAAIVRGEELIIAAHNEVWMATDITAHAEVTAIQRACGIVGGIDLSGCTIYSTCEPCPMCFCACHWARLDRIVYAAAIGDAQGAGFNELAISNEELKRTGGATIAITTNVLREEGVGLFQQWLSMPIKKSY